MSGKEGQPYQFKHSKQISLDGYKGIASDLMELNEPIADGFMQATDMRSDIVVTSIGPTRALEYDQLGDVMAAKMLSLPRFDFWRKEGFRHTVRRDGVWHIAINDQALSNNIAHSDNQLGRFDEVFVDRFKTEVAQGVKSCLRREKLFNNGEYNFSFLLGYQSLIVWNIAFPTLYGTALALQGEVTPEQIAGVGVLMAGSNVVHNSLFMMFALIQEVKRKFLPPSILTKQFDKRTFPFWNDPLVKHNGFELIAPPIAIDRVARGLLYLRKHGDELITVDKNHAKAA